MKFTFLKRITSAAIAATALFTSMPSAHAYEWENRHYQFLVLGMASGTLFFGNPSPEWTMFENVLTAWRNTPTDQAVQYGTIFNSTCGSAAQTSAQTRLSQIPPHAVFPGNETDFFSRATLLRLRTHVYDLCKAPAVSSLADTGPDPYTIWHMINLYNNIFRGKKQTITAACAQDPYGSACKTLRAFEAAYTAHNSAYLQLISRRDSLKRAWDARNTSTEAMMTYINQLFETSKSFSPVAAKLREGVNLLSPGYLP